jgi:hypothetical protein
MQRKFVQSFHVPGELSANLTITWTVPSGCKLVHVSACQSDADAAGLIIGDSDDADEYLTTQSFGVSGTPAEFDGDDFVDTAGNSHDCYYPVIAAGTVMIATVDFDYNAAAGSGAASDITLVLTFVEGGV